MPKDRIQYPHIFKSEGSWGLKVRKTLDLLIGGLFALIVRKRPFPQGRTPDSSPHKILVIRPGGIGDAVFVLPFLVQIKELCSDIRIDVVCEKRNKDVFASQPCCADVYCYDGPFTETWKALSRQYDCVFDTEQWHYLSGVLANLSKASLRVGFETRPGRAKFYDRLAEYDEQAPELENFSRLFKTEFPVRETYRLVFDLSDPLMVWAKQRVSQRSVSLYLGGSIALRRFDYDQACGITEGLLERGYEVLLIGGRDAENVGKRLAAHLQDRRIKDFINTTSLSESAALIKHSVRFIGTDSGLMHIACAVGTPVIAVFGPGNARKWEPVGEGHSVIRKDLECSPCTRFGYTIPDCSRKGLCMNDIRAEEILSVFDRSLGVQTDV